MKIAIQGQHGSYHHQAVLEYFGEDATPFFCRTFDEVFEAIESGNANHAMVASENSLYGSINEVYDLLLKHSALHITGEVYLRIHHCLIGSQIISLDAITDVYSHHAAIGQCRQFLKTELTHARVHIHEDTAGAVADILEQGKPESVAIASTFAADTHGGVILRRNIETNPENYTRFIVLSRGNGSPKKATKTSIILQTTGKDEDDDQRPGSLYRALGCFAENDINLTKLESRPLIGKAWHYLFYIDFEAGSQEERTQKTLNELAENNCHVQVLGSYKAANHN